MNNTTRRNFIRTAAGGVVAAIAAPVLATKPLAQVEPCTPVADMAAIKVASRDMFNRGRRNAYVVDAIRKLKRGEITAYEFERFVVGYATVIMHDGAHREIFTHPIPGPIVYWKCSFRDCTWLHSGDIHFVRCNLMETDDGPKLTRRGLEILQASGICRGLQYFSYGELFIDRPRKPGGDISFNAYISLHSREAPQWTPASYEQSLQRGKDRK